MTVGRGRGEAAEVEDEAAARFEQPLSLFDNSSSQRMKLSKCERERNKAAWPELKLAQIRRLQCLLSLSLSSAAASSFLQGVVLSRKSEDDDGRERE